MISQNISWPPSMIRTILSLIILEKNIIIALVVVTTSACVQTTLCMTYYQQENICSTCTHFLNHLPMVQVLWSETDGTPLILAKIKLVTQITQTIKTIDTS
jgi:hypothetical protein